MDTGWATVIAAAVAVLGAVGGVWVGGRISGRVARETAKIAADTARESALVAQRVAEADRGAAHDAQFAADARRLAAQLLAGVESRFLEVEAQVEWRRQPYVVRRQAGEMPTTGPEDFYAVMTELHLTVRIPATASAAWQCCRSVLVLSQQYAARPRDLDEDGVPRPIDQATYKGWLDSAAHYKHKRRVFINAMRSEFGMPEFGMDGPAPDQREVDATAPIT
jgi:hypothetical protein